VRVFSLPNRGVGVVFRRRGAVALGAVATGCALLAACTPSPPPAATPSPSGTSATPSAPPTESDIERRMRLDYEAAEKAYRATIAEHDRLTASAEPEVSAALKATVTGTYLRIARMGLRKVHDSGWKSVGRSEIVGVSRAGWKANDIHLISCEDYSHLRFVDRGGHDVTPKGPRRYVQDLTVIKTPGGWKMSDVSSTVVESFESSPCAR
jgi:hypothetical protein